MLRKTSVSFALFACVSSLLCFPASVVAQTEAAQALAIAQDAVRVNQQQSRKLKKLFKANDTQQVEINMLSAQVDEIVANPVAGPVGPQGPAGLQGPKGDTGAQGPAGLQGLRGFTGLTGAVGPQGPMGLSGPVGPQGPVGAMGPTGAVGPAGPAGPVGPQGPKGNTGATGPAGAMGPKGDTGNTGLQGPVGPQGPKGDQGDPATFTCTQRAQSEQFPSASTHTTAVACPGGTIAAIPGYSIFDSTYSSKVHMKASFTSGSSWVFIFACDHGAGACQGIPINVNVMCCAGSIQ